MGPVLSGYGTVVLPQLGQRVAENEVVADNSSAAVKRKSLVGKIIMREREKRQKSCAEMRSVSWWLYK